MSLSSDYGAPLKSKEELIMYVPCLYFKRRAPLPASPVDNAIEELAHDLANPLPSSATTPVDLIATGTTLPPSSPTSPRIIAKRIILTGHPFKIHKKLVTVRYMFFSDQDVEYFKALQLWTKRGRQGFVKEALGTHGYFKATFDGKVGPLDAVGVSLYKRVWPRGARAWRRGDESRVGDVGMVREGA
ncbi:hypothetical protein B0A55_08358 [Friedmanniomyces simplex]|uniref:Ribosome biogenesis protein BMS1/TSR1 C-terminal domain-containing protein n=1 Tax=Friedmanniomyces simplex TaxID=329884 RepID=A0A4U0X831_9PEZI|nr:hypothetical protein B0A55_08358 [Friedmanniomyces simplex]